MGCGGMGGCGGSNSSSNKTSNHAPKKAPNWGMTTKPMGTKKNNGNSSSGGFGQPKVRMSFGRRGT